MWPRERHERGERTAGCCWGRRRRDSAALRTASRRSRRTSPLCASRASPTRSAPQPPATRFWRNRFCSLFWLLLLGSVNFTHTRLLKKPDATCENALCNAEFAETGTKREHFVHAAWIHSCLLKSFLRVSLYINPNSSKHLWNWVHTLIRTSSCPPNMKSACSVSAHTTALRPPWAQECHQSNFSIADYEVMKEARAGSQRRNMLVILRKEQVTHEARVEYGASAGSEHYPRVWDASHYYRELRIDEEEKG